MEGFGITIADAMSFACVPIAGASGGPLDFIRHEETGYLVDGLDQGAIESALRALHDHPGMRENMSLAARNFAIDKLTWNQHVENILQRI